METFGSLPKSSSWYRKCHTKSMARLRSRFFPWWCEVVLVCVVSVCAVDDAFDSRPVFYFTEEPSGKVYGAQDGSVCMDCKAACSRNGSIEIIWRKDDRIINSTAQRYMLPNGSLCIRRLRKAVHEGFYECLAQHQVGTIVSSRVKLELEEMSLPMSVAPLNWSATEGESVRFQCMVNATPWPVIEWTKDDNSLLEDDHRVTILKNSGVLQLTNITKQDEGEYKCVARNETSVAGTLTVVLSNSDSQLTAAALLGRPRDQIVIKSQTVILECFVNGRPPPLVNWTKQGVQMIEDAHQFGSGNLEIVDVTESDAGVYVCSWIDPESGHNVTAQANVTVYAPPRLLPDVSMKSYTLKRREQVIRLTCRFSGWPVPRVTWFKNGQKLEQTNRVKIERFELSISQARTTDAGMYQCRAENPAGAQMATTLLEFASNERSPYPPTTLLAMAINSTSVRLSWKDHPRNRNRGVTAYSVHIAPSGDLEFQHVVPYDGQSGGSLVLENLRPYTNYSVFVVAYNVHGGSQHSRKIFFLTAEDGIPSVPQMTAVAVSSSAILVNWTSRRESVLVIGYKLLCRVGGSTRSTKAEVPVMLGANVNQHAFQNLEPSTSYQIRLVAFNSKGESPSAVQNIRTGSVSTESSSVSTSPSQSSLSVKAEPLNSTAVLLHWTKPLQTTVAEYTIRYRISATDATVETSALLNSTAYTSLRSFLVDRVIVSSLSPFTSYEFYIEVGGNQATFTGNVKCKTLEGVPTVPMDLDVTLVEPGLVNVRWNPPQSCNGVIIKYVVYYTKDDDWQNTYWISKTENGTSLSTLIENLKKDSVYYFQIEAATSAGSSPRSTVVHAKTGFEGSQTLTDQELGIIIGTSIGVTCIIICTCIILLHYRCRQQPSAHAVPAVDHALNNTVTPCHCQPRNCSAEFHVLRPRASNAVVAHENNHPLIENRNCDTKGGNLQNGRNPRLSELENNSHSEIRYQVMPLLHKSNCGSPAADALDLEGIDYDDDSTVTLKFASPETNCSNHRETELKDIQDSACSNDAATSDRLLGGHLPSRDECDSPVTNPTTREKPVTGDDAERHNTDDCCSGDGHTTSQNDKFSTEQTTVQPNVCSGNCSEVNCSRSKKL